MRIKERTIEFVAVSILLGGLLYAATTAYQTSSRLSLLETSIERNSTAVTDLINKLRTTLLTLLIEQGAPPDKISALFAVAGLDGPESSDLVEHYESVVKHHVDKHNFDEALKTLDFVMLQDTIDVDLPHLKKLKASVEEQQIQSE